MLPDLFSGPECTRETHPIQDWDTLLDTRTLGVLCSDHYETKVTKTLRKSDRCHSLHKVGFLSCCLKDDVTIARGRKRRGTQSLVPSPTARLLSVLLQRNKEEELKEIICIYNYILCVNTDNSENVR